MIKKKAPLCKLGIEENLLGLIRQIYQKKKSIPNIALKSGKQCFPPRLKQEKDVRSHCLYSMIVQKYIVIAIGQEM